MLSGKMRILLLIDATTRYGRSIGSGVGRFAMENDWEIVYEPRGPLEPLPGWTRQWRGNGIIARTADPTILQPFRHRRVPIVEMMGDARKRPPDIVVDENLLGDMAASYFLSKGFRHFAFYSFGQSWWSIERERCFLAALAQRGYTCRTIPHLTGDPRDSMPVWQPSDEQRLLDWLATLPHPTALFAANDLHAHHVLLACQSLFIAVPEKIAILGSGNDPWYCRFQPVPLSSIQTDGFTAGYRAAELMARLLKGESKPTAPIRIAPQHVSTRLSTDIIAVEEEDVVLALQFIRSHAVNGISVADVVSHVCISQKSLERKFKRFLKKTPQQEILDVRIQKIKELLHETSLPLSSIAKKVGFQTPEYLVRIFKRECGLTPNEYRHSADSDNMSD